MFYLRDNFEGPNGTPLQDHVMDIGGGWTAVSGTAITIEGGRASLSAAGTQIYKSTQNIFIDGRLRSGISQSALSSGRATGLIARLVDTNNHMMIALFNGDLLLSKRVAGVVTTLATVVGVAQLLDHLYQLEWMFSGPDHVVKLDGVSVIDLSDASLLTGTGVGLRAVGGSSYTTTWDDFRFLSLGPSEGIMANIKNVIGRPTVVQEGMSQIADVLVGGADDWQTGGAPPVMHLYSNDPAITPQIELDEFTECVGSGYAEVVMDSLFGGTDEDGVPVIQGPVPAAFEMDALDTLFSATGYYITDENSDSLIACERFDAEFPFDEVGDKILVTPRILLPPFTPPEDTVT